MTKPAKLRTSTRRIALPAAAPTTLIALACLVGLAFPIISIYSLKAPPAARHWSESWMPEWLISDNSAPILWQTDREPMVSVLTKQNYDDHLTMEVKSARLYGFRIGQPIKLRYLITTLSSNNLQFETLTAGKLLREPTPWRLIGKPQYKTVRANGLVTATVDLTVAFWEPPVSEPNAGPKLVPFQFEFFFSNQNQADELPIWEYRQTPPLDVGFSSSLEPDARYFELGPLGVIPDRYSRPRLTIMAVGLLFALCGVFYWLNRLLSWLRRGPATVELPVQNRQFWQAMADAEYIRQSPSYYAAVHLAFRQFLGDATLSSEELAKAWIGHPRQREIEETLKILDQAFYANESNSFDWQRALAFMKDFVAQRVEPKAPRGWLSSQSRRR